MPRFSAIIPARSGSKSIKDKNLALLGGHPLIAYSIALAKTTEGIDRVIVSTDSLEYAKIAEKFDIRVYTIGVGTEGFAPYPFKTPFGTTVYQDIEVQIDEKTLQDIATTTNGKYFRATSNKALKEIYLEIDKLERSKIDVKEFSKKNEEFRFFIWIAISLLLIEFYCKKFLFKSIT